MNAFRVLLILIISIIAVYTSIVIADHGFNLFPVFFGDMTRMAWPGQFNLDFMCMLLLSGFWLAWRHHFSPAGLALGVLGFLGGAPVLCGYLFIVSLQTNGNVKEMLLGKVRAAG